jgi:hypothetical protein
MNPIVLLGLSALKNFRGLKTVLIAGALILLLLLGLAIWAGVAAFGWLSNQAPAVKEMLSIQVPAARDTLNQKIPELREHIEGIAPEIAQGVEEWLPGKKPEWREVPGEDPGAIARYEGLVRTLYAVHDHSRTAVFEGVADFKLVAAHYHARFIEKGWPHRVLFAAAEEEKHEYRSKDLRFEVHVKDFGGAVKVEIVEFPVAQRADRPQRKPDQREKGTL